MAPIVATLLIGLVAKIGGDLLMNKAKKLFADQTTKNGAQPSASAPPTSFASAFADVRAQQGEAAPPAAASSVPGGTTNFAALPAAAAGTPASAATGTTLHAAAAAYTRLDSIQTA